MRAGRLSLFIWGLFMGAGVAAAETLPEIRVDMDYARLVKMPAGARSFVLGNPAIVDATLLRDGGLLVVSGKSFGATNLITPSGVATSAIAINPLPGFVSAPINTLAFGE